MKIDTATNTFYYVLDRHFEMNGEDCIEHYVMRYAFDKKWHNCFDEDRMFSTMHEAQALADRLNSQHK